MRKRLELDWSDPDRVWLQLRRAGLLPDRVGPQHLREAHEEVERQRERRELAEAWHRQYEGLPPTPQQRTTDFAAERDPDPNPAVEDARKAAEAWIGREI